MSDNLEIFRKDFLNAYSWPQRKDGVPLYLLDNLTKDELKVAESELIRAANIGDNWHIEGLGHIRSTKSLKKLYKLLGESSNGMKATIAHSIFQICEDIEMIEIVLSETAKITSVYELIDIVYMLSDFKDERTDTLLKEFCNHKEYLVAYNAKRAINPSGK